MEEKGLIMKPSLGEHFCALGSYRENKAMLIKEKVYVREDSVIIRRSI